jgi:hypothetical protein
MVPWGLIIGAALAANRQKRTGGSSLPWWAITGWLWWLALSLVAGITRQGWLWVPSLAGMLVWAFPWAFTRLVLIPLGQARAAYFVASSSDLVWSRDHLGGGAAAAAWALLRQKRPRAADIQWVRERLEKASPLRGAGVLAMGLLEVARGRLETARDILRQVDTLHEGVTPDASRRCAAEWLAADAAQRGDWATVALLGRSPLPRTQATRFLGHAAARLMGINPVPSNLSLVARWLLVPAPWRLWPLLQRALKADAAARSAGREKAVFAPDGVEIPPTHRMPRLARVLAHHAWAAACPPESLHPEEVGRLALAWDAALHDGATTAWCTERALLLQCTGGETALRSLEDAVVEDLSRLARESGAHVPEPLGNGVASRVAWAVRNALLEDVEQACKALEERAEAKRVLPSPEEWRAWMALRATCERAARQGGPGVRRLMFPTLNERAVSWAVWLWNDRKERMLAHQVFAFMRDEAEAVGDERAHDLHKKNAACGV